MDNPSPSTARFVPGRVLFWLSLVLGLLAPIFYALQLSMGSLTKPWYLPILGTAAAALALGAVWRRFGIGRLLVGILLVLLAAFEWSLFSTTKLPAYAGPVTIGRAFPAFATTLADGSQFTEANLAGPQSTALVFFRGRW
jgi:hypothetical protein